MRRNYLLTSAGVMWETSTVRQLTMHIDYTFQPEPSLAIVTFMYSVIPSRGLTGPTRYTGTRRQHIEELAAGSLGQRGHQKRR